MAMTSPRRALIFETNPNRTATIGARRQTFRLQQSALLSNMPKSIKTRGRWVSVFKAVILE